MTYHITKKTLPISYDSFQNQSCKNRYSRLLIFFIFIFFNRFCGKSSHITTHVPYARIIDTKRFFNNLLRCKSVRTLHHITTHVPYETRILTSVNVFNSRLSSKFIIGSYNTITHCNISQIMFHMLQKMAKSHFIFVYKFDRR